MPPEHPLAGVERHLRLTAEIQRAYPDLPVVGTGYSWLRHYALNAAEASIDAGNVTMVGLGRGALAYPDFALDALTLGRMERDRACIGVSYCTALMRAKHNELGQYATGCVPRDRHVRRVVQGGGADGGMAVGYLTPGPLSTPVARGSLSRAVRVEIGTHRVGRGRFFAALRMTTFVLRMTSAAK